MMRAGKDYCVKDFCVGITDDYDNKHLGRYQRRRAFKALREKLAADETPPIKSVNQNKPTLKLAR